MQLKIYIQERTIYPEMDGSYVAMAVNNRIFKQMFVAHSMDIESTAVFIACPITIVVIFMVVILLIAMIHYFFRDTFKEGGLNRHRKAAIVSSAIISFNRLVYFIALDICAITFKKNNYPEYTVLMDYRLANYIQFYIIFHGFFLHLIYSFLYCHLSV